MDVFRHFRTYLFKIQQRIYPASKKYCKIHLCPPPNTLFYGGGGRISNLAFQPGSDAWFLPGADEEEILDGFVAKWNGWFRKVSVTIEYSRGLKGIEQ